MFLIIAGNVVLMALIATAIVGFLGGGIWHDRKHRERTAGPENVKQFPSVVWAERDDDLRRAA